MCGDTTNYYGTDIQIQFMVNSYLRSIGVGQLYLSHPGQTKPPESALITNSPCLARVREDCA